MAIKSTANDSYPKAFWKSCRNRPVWAEEATPAEWFTRWIAAHGKV